MHDVLVAGQLDEAAGAARVEFVGTDPNLRSQAQLAPIIKPGTGIHHHRRRIDRSCELASGGGVIGDDRFGVVRAILGDVVDGFLNRVDHAGRENEVEVFGAVVRLGGELGVGQVLPNSFVAPHLDPVSK